MSDFESPGINPKWLRGMKRAGSSKYREDERRQVRFGEASIKKDIAELRRDSKALRHEAFLALAPSLNIYGFTALGVIEANCLARKPFDGEMACRAYEATRLSYLMAFHFHLNRPRNPESDTP